MEAVLRWANMLKSHLKVGAPFVLRFHFSDTNNFLGCFQRSFDGTSVSFGK